jgi:phage anti-repressor protein
LIAVKLARLDGKDVFCIDAREVHRRLGVGRMFSHWIKDRIDRHGFVEGKDFEVFANLAKTPFGGRPSTEYQVTTDMAYDLASAEGGPAAVAFTRELRARADAVLKAPVKPDYDVIFKDPDVALKIVTEWKREHDARVWADAKIGCLEAKIEENRVCTAVGRLVTTNEEFTVSFGVAANVLNDKGANVNRNSLLAEYRARGLLIRQKDDRWNCPTRKGMRLGLVTQTYIICSDGKERPQSVLKVKGIADLGRRHLGYPLKPEDFPSEELVTVPGQGFRYVRRVFRHRPLTFQPPPGA